MKRWEGMIMDDDLDVHTNREVIYPTQGGNMRLMASSSVIIVVVAKSFAQESIMVDIELYHFSRSIKGMSI